MEAMDVDDHNFSTDTKEQERVQLIAEKFEQQIRLSKRRRKIRGLKSEKSLQLHQSFKVPTVSAKMFHSFTFIFLFLISIPISLIIFDYVHDDYRFHKEKVNLPNLRTELKTIIQQGLVTEALLNSLAAIVEQNWRTPMKVMPFIGSTGVGKTHVTNILKNNFYYSYVHDVHNFNIDDHSLKYCCNIVIIDNLSGRDINESIAFIRNLPADRVAMAIPIFSTHEVTENLGYVINHDLIGEITKSFQMHFASFEALVFNMIQRDDVLNFVGEYLNKRGMNADRCREKIEHYVDTYVSDYGFKLVHQKDNYILHYCASNEL